MPEIAVQNVMAFVRDEGISVGILAKRNRSSQSGDSLRDHRLRKRDHFHRERKFPQHTYLLGGISDDDKLLRSGGDHLLPQQRATPALDQAKCGIKFISAVD